MSFLFLLFLYVFSVSCEDEIFTSAFKLQLPGETGTIYIEAHKEWAPLGYVRFKELVESNYFDQARFFRVIPNFMAQFGISGDPKATKKWRDKSIKDDPKKKSNQRGYVTFATSGPNTRTTQLFINYRDNGYLDNQGFTPFAVVKGNGMDLVDKIYKIGESPDQGRYNQEGTKYIKRNFPKASYVITARADTGKKSLPAPDVAKLNNAVKTEKIVKKKNPEHVDDVEKPVSSYGRTIWVLMLGAAAFMCCCLLSGMCKNKGSRNYRSVRTRI